MVFSILLPKRLADLYTHHAISNHWHVQIVEIRKMGIGCHIIFHHQCICCIELDNMVVCRKFQSAHHGANLSFDDFACRDLFEVDVIMEKTPLDGLVTGCCVFSFKCFSIVAIRT